MLGGLVATITWVQFQNKSDKIIHILSVWINFIISFHTLHKLLLLNEIFVEVVHWNNTQRSLHITDGVIFQWPSWQREREVIFLSYKLLVLNFSLHWMKYASTVKFHSYHTGVVTSWLDLQLTFSKHVYRWSKLFLQYQVQVDIIQILFPLCCTISNLGQAVSVAWAFWSREPTSQAITLKCNKQVHESAHWKCC